MTIKIEIEHFDADPDGDAMRAGDGYYWRELGKNDGWSGAWHSEEEALENARDDLDDDEVEVATAEELKAFELGYPAPGDNVQTEDGPAVVDSLDYERGHEYAPHVILAEEVEGLGKCTRRTEASFLIRTGPSSWRERLPRAGTVGGAAPHQVLDIGTVYQGAPLPDEAPPLEWRADLSDLPAGHALVVVGDASAGRDEAWMLDVAFSDRAQGEALRPVIMDAARRLLTQPAARVTAFGFGHREVATVLASLRAMQNVQQHEALAPEIMEIATDGGTLTPLDDGEVDALCQALNFGDGAIGDPASILRAMLESGRLDISAAQRVIGEHHAKQEPELQPYRDAVPVVDGETECDANAIVSVSDDGGAYVQTWTWVSDEAAGITHEDQDEEAAGTD